MSRPTLPLLLLPLAAALLVAGGVLYESDSAPGADAESTAARPPAAAPSLDGTLLVRTADRLTPRMDGAVHELGPGGDVRPAGDLVCKRVAVSLRGTGLCLALTGDGKTYEGIVFGAGYEPHRRFPVVGVPDRARVSDDGRLGAFTTFDAGSSQGYFANAGGFSVGTRIVDMRTAKTILDLEEDLAVRRGGRPFAPDDAQFWGVTFAGGDRFYATMASGFEHYLIEGRAGARRARVIDRGIECPALSPDGSRIAYKRRIGYTNRWRLHVRDLRSGRDVALAERRSIDDQPEWLDDDRVLYSDDRGVFVVAADGSGQVRRLAARATSPTVPRRADGR